MAIRCMESFTALRMPRMELRASCKSSAPSQLLLYFSISWGGRCGEGHCRLDTEPRPSQESGWDALGHGCGSRAVVTGGARPHVPWGTHPLPRCRVGGMVSLPSPWPSTPSCAQLHPPQLTSPTAPPSRSDPRTNEHLSQLFTPALRPWGSAPQDATVSRTQAASRVLWRQGLPACVPAPGP